MDIELTGLSIATLPVWLIKFSVSLLPVLFSAGDRRIYFNIPPHLSVDLGLLNLALFIAKELEN